MRNEEINITSASDLLHLKNDVYQNYSANRSSDISIHTKCREVAKILNSEIANNKCYTNERVHCSKSNIYKK